MIDFENLTERQRNCIPDVHFELIPIKNLVSNQDYQRDLSEGHITKTLQEFDVYQIRPVKVSHIRLRLLQPCPALVIHLSGA